LKSSDFVGFQPYFSAQEDWGDLERVNWLIPWACYQIRTGLIDIGFNWPMHIHCAFELGGHSANSYHYKGLAVDFHFSKTYSTLVNEYVALEAVLKEMKLDKFVGLGVYPYWNSKGFHLDLRGVGIRWVKVREKYEYGNEIKIKRLLFENS